MEPTTLRIGAVGAFSGDPGPRVEARPAVREIDRDCFDSVLADRAVGVALATDGSRLEFQGFDDFRPESIAARVPSLAALLRARAAVDRPAEMRAALSAAGLRADFAEAARPATRPVEGTPRDLLDSILGGEDAARPARAVRRTGDPALDRLLALVGRSSRSAVGRAERERLCAAIDAELARRLRALLRDPAVQRVEAAWRALHELVHTAETGETLRLYVIDTPDDPGDRARAPRGLALPAPHAGGGRSFDLYACVEPVRDALEVEALARAAHEAGARAVAPAADGVVALALSSGADWEKLRRIEGAERVALCWPRLLLRLPYGSNADPVDGFEFEEWGGDEADVSPLLGGGALAIAACAAASFARLGTPAQAARFCELAGRPLHALRRDGEPRVLGPTERPVREAEVHALRDAGIIPFVSFRGEDRVLVASFRALSGAPLLGVST